MSTRMVVLKQDASRVTIAFYVTKGRRKLAGAKMTKICIDIEIWWAEDARPSGFLNHSLGFDFPTNRTRFVQPLQRFHAP